MIRQVQVFKHALSVIKSVHSFVTSLPLSKISIRNLEPNSLEFTISIYDTPYCFCVYVDFDQYYLVQDNKSYCVYCYNEDIGFYTDCEVSLSTYIFNYHYELNSYMINCINQIDKYVEAKRKELYNLILLKIMNDKSELELEIYQVDIYSCYSFRIRFVSSFPEIKKYGFSIIFVKEHIFCYSQGSNFFESGLLYKDKLIYNKKMGYRDTCNHNYDKFINKLVYVRSILEEKYNIKYTFIKACVYSQMKAHY